MTGKSGVAGEITAGSYTMCASDSGADVGFAFHNHLASMNFDNIQMSQDVGPSATLCVAYCKGLFFYDRN